MNNRFMTGHLRNGLSDELSWEIALWTKRMMNDAEEVELLYRYVDGDMPLLRRILVNNPARLHGFDK